MKGDQAAAAAAEGFAMLDFNWNISEYISSCDK